MATVVITFFLLTRFYVCKMDADCIDRRRDRILSRREKRWSMNSQRLEEIVAELMKPISDVRRSFDTDLSALLEEYLTEAGLHALEAGEAAEGDSDGDGEADAGPVAPNFAELALLLQHSASVYGRKVDFLYQHVLSVSDSLQQSTQELDRSTNEPDAEATAGRRRRRASAAAGFEPLELAACPGAARDPAPPRPPPTLPRVYVELEPRTLTAADLPLTDYDAEPVGLLADFHVSWRLQDGMLVDELEGWGGESTGGLRPIPLMELQAAIEAAAPPALPPPPDLDPPHTPPRALSPLPLHASTPLPDAATPPPVEPAKKERKRKLEGSRDDLVGGCFKIILNKELRRKFRKLNEFALDEAWIAGVVATRREHILAHRRKLRDKEKNFRGFDESDLDIGGFPGWSSVEAAVAAESSTSLAAGATAAGAAAAAAGADSDDDGFFERSSLGDSDASRVDDSCLATPGALASLDNSGWSTWQANVVARAAAGEARGLDVRDLAQRVLQQLPAEGQAPSATSCEDLLRNAAADQRDVPGLFLATLFLANAGNVEVIQGPPLTLNSFSVRLLSTDERLYSAAAQDDPHFLR